MRLIPLAFLALMPVAAAAQEASDDVTYDEALLTTCLQGKEASARAECIGAAADACIENSPNAITDMGTALCLNNEAGSWDDLLNSVYKKLMSLEKAADAEMGEASRAEALKAMQRAWIPYRDATCDYDVAQWGNGTGASVAYANCMMRMTAAQALDLVSRLENHDS